MTSKSLALLGLLPVLFLACAAEEEEEENPAGYENAILAGAVTDETLVGFVNALDTNGTSTVDSRSPILTVPSDGEAVAEGSTLVWELGAQTSGVSKLAGAAQPDHGTPYTGYATYLEITAEGSSDPLLQVFTSEFSYTLTAEDVDALAAGGSSFSISLLGADFESDRVIPDGGPYLGSVTGIQL